MCSAGTGMRTTIGDSQVGSIPKSLLQRNSAIQSDKYWELSNAYSCQK